MKDFFCFVLSEQGSNVRQTKQSFDLATSDGLCHYHSSCNSSVCIFLNNLKTRRLAVQKLNLVSFPYHCKSALQTTECRCKISCLKIRLTSLNSQKCGKNIGVLLLF